jgi:hypothetical protein
MSVLSLLCIVLIARFSHAHSFTRQIIYCATNCTIGPMPNPQYAASPPPFHCPLKGTVKYMDPVVGNYGELGIHGAPLVKVYFSLTAFPNDEKDHFLHSALLFETVLEGSYFHLRNSHGEYQEGKYFNLDAHEGIMGATVGSDRREISKAMLNLEEKWIARHDSYDIFVSKVMLSQRKIENLLKVIDETRSKVFTLPTQQKDVKASIFLEGIVIGRKSVTLEPYNNCGMFNIRCLKALGIDRNPLDRLVDRDIRRIFGCAVVKKLAKKSSSIESSMKRDLMTESEFFLNEDPENSVSHHKGLVSYDYSDPRVFENAMKSMRNWVLFMKSIWNAL